MQPRRRSHRRSGAAVAPHEAALLAWRRRKWLALLVFSATLVGAVSLTLALPDVYRAAATVIVERQQMPEAFVRPSITAELETRIQTIHEQVMSRARLTEVILAEGLYRELRGDWPMNAIVDRMRNDIQLQLRGVDQMTGRTATIAFTLGYRGRDPQAVARVANRLAHLYIEEHADGRERQASRTASFLKEQLDEVKRALDEQERRASDYRLRYTNEMPQQLEANLAALERLNTQLRLNGEYQLRAIERRERFERQIAEARGTREDTAAPASQLAQLEGQLAALRTQYSEQYPDVIRLKGEIAALRQEGAGAPPAEDTADAGARIRRALGDTDAELQGLRQEESLLRQAIASYEQRVENAPRRQQELQELSSGYESTREHYQVLLKRYEDAQLAASLEEGYNPEQFRILDPALPPERPAAPDRVWLLLMGLVAATGLAVGVVLAAEKLDTSFHAADDLRAFIGAPVLATIRPIVTKSDRRRTRLRFALAAAAGAVVLALIAAATHRVADGNEQIVRLMARSGL
jgi:polysaccharide chain length determinant protein (PEP-CTERM system associated)